jgi:hypothetical protein
MAFLLVMLLEVVLIDATLRRPLAIVLASEGLPTSVDAVVAVASVVAVISLLIPSIRHPGPSFKRGRGTRSMRLSRPPARTYHPTAASSPAGRRGTRRRPTCPRVRPTLRRPTWRQ